MQLSEILTSNSNADFDGSKLTPTDVERILERSGYTGMSIRRANFIGLSTDSKSLVYKCLFNDPEGSFEEGTKPEGKVYITFDENGKLTADF